MWHLSAWGTQLYGLHYHFKYQSRVSLSSRFNVDWYGDFLSDSPSFAFCKRISLCHVVWGRAAIHIYGPHLWDNHSRDKFAMVILLNLLKKSYNTTSCISTCWPFESYFCEGFLTLQEWKGPVLILLMALWCSLHGWWVDELAFFIAFTKMTGT